MQISDIFVSPSFLQSVKCGHAMNNVHRTRFAELIRFQIRRMTKDFDGLLVQAGFIDKSERRSTDADFISICQYRCVGLGSIHRGAIPRAGIQNPPTSFAVQDLGMHPRTHRVVQLNLALSSTSNQRLDMTIQWQLRIQVRTTDHLQVAGHWPGCEKKD